MTLCGACFCDTHTVRQPLAEGFGWARGWSRLSVSLILSDARLGTRSVDFACDVVSVDEATQAVEYTERGNHDDN